MNEKEKILYLDFVHKKLHVSAVHDQGLPMVGNCLFLRARGVGNRPPRNKKMANPGGHAPGGGGMVTGGIEPCIIQLCYCLLLTFFWIWYFCDMIHNLQLLVQFFAVFSSICPVFLRLHFTFGQQSAFNTNQSETLQSVDTSLLMVRQENIDSLKFKSKNPAFL